MLAREFINKRPRDRSILKDVVGDAIIVIKAAAKEGKEMSNITEFVEYLFKERIDDFSIGVLMGATLFKSLDDIIKICYEEKKPT